MALTKVSNSMLVQPVNHNILINPSFTVNQRGTVVEHANSSYGPDRWGVSGLSSSGGTKVKSSTKVDDATNVNKLVVTHEGTTSGSAHTYQRVETVNLLGLYGKEMTLSFSFSNTGTPNLPNVRIYTWNAAGAYSIIHEAVPTSLGNSRWTCTFTLSTDDGTIPKATDVGLGVTIYSNENKTDPAPNEWYLWETKLEVGSVATPFIARSHGEELALCQRYYYRTPLVSGGYYSTGLAGSATSCRYVIQYPVEMRSPPSGTTSGSFQNGGLVSADLTSFSFGQTSSLYSIALCGSTSPSMTGGQAFQLRNKNDATAYLEFDAEL